MIGYYLQLAWQNLRRQAWLTVFTVISIGIGIGTSMTVYTLMHTLGSDPLPGKSDRFYTPHLVLREPVIGGTWDIVLTLLTHRDALELVRSGPAARRALLYRAETVVASEDNRFPPVSARTDITQADFFAMFEVPFRAGGAWTREQEESGTPLVVLTAQLAEQLFPEGDALGQTLQIRSRPHTVVGVMDVWDPFPRFYDLYGSTPQTYSEAQIFLPFDAQNPLGPVTFDCTSIRDHSTVGAGFQGFVASDCVWIQLWLELGSAAEVEAYRGFLDAYATSVQESGRFPYRPFVELLSLRDWLHGLKFVPPELRVANLIAAGFLLVCLVNAVALMLARFASVHTSLAISRALGAPRIALFTQCLVESLVISGLGAVAGLLLTMLGVMVQRQLLSGVMAAAAARLDISVVLITLAIAALATIAVSLFPAWRASRGANAPMLKMQ